MIWPFRKKPYDPDWLVEAARQVEQEYPWLPMALAACTESVENGWLYVRFITSKRANKPGSEWQFRESVILEDTVHGDVIVDVLEGNRIGGVEFYDRLFEGKGESA